VLNVKLPIAKPRVSAESRCMRSFAVCTGAARADNACARQESIRMQSQRSEVWWWLFVPTALLVTLWFNVPHSTTVPSVLHSDLAMHFTCAGRSGREVSSRISAFLLGKNLRALDRAAIQMKHGIHLLPVDLLAIKNDEKLVTVTMLPHKQSYSLTLVTKPPTKRDGEIEAAIVQLLSVDLNCAIYQRSTNINDASVIPLFETTMKLALHQFEEEVELRRKR
jgi:hypothetical protein